MHLSELIIKHEAIPSSSVPDWMMGCFKRKSITFATAQTDNSTHVFWLQTANLTIDLRLPLEKEWIDNKPFADFNAEELEHIANYEGWYAESLWQGALLSWQNGCSYQLHNRWPEPAELKRVGDCMMEFAPSGAYVEDWRLQNQKSGPLVGLKLIKEQLHDGSMRDRDGALIVCGEWAGLVLDRTEPINDNGSQLRDLAKPESPQLASLLEFETSIAQGSLEEGFKITHSLQKQRIGKALFSLEGFDWDEASGCITHTTKEQDQPLTRYYKIDVIKPVFDFDKQTNWTSAAKSWFEQEQKTLGRYL